MAFFTMKNLGKAKVFPDSRPPHPATDDVIHGLLGLAAARTRSRKWLWFAADATLSPKPPLPHREC